MASLRESQSDSHQQQQLQASGEKDEAEDCDKIRASFARLMQRHASIAPDSVSHAALHQFQMSMMGASTEESDISGPPLPPCERLGVMAAFPTFEDFIQ